jgi:hypothetical protein
MVVLEHKAQWNVACRVNSDKLVGFHHRVVGLLMDLTAHAKDGAVGEGFRRLASVPIAALADVADFVLHRSEQQRVDFVAELLLKITRSACVAHNVTKPSLPSPGRSIKRKGWGLLVEAMVERLFVFVEVKVCRATNSVVGGLKPRTSAVTRTGADARPGLEA